MTEEGKYSRAMEKGGASGNAPPDPGERAPAQAPIVEHVPDLPADELADFRRVTGMCYPPPPVIAVGRGGQENTVPEADAKPKDTSRRKGNLREVASQIRSVRHRILAMNGGVPPRVIMVTSSTVGEGKTTIAMNLGAALAETDSTSRVVVVDGDLPAPALHVVAGLKDEVLLPGKNPDIPLGARTGICDILTNGLDLNGNVYETTIPNLDVIPGRTMPEQDSFERPLNERCKDFLDKLRKYYSFVIIDTPPVHASSQALTFGKYCDGVVIVARLERTGREIVRNTVDAIQTAQGKVIGCVLTHHEHHVPNFIYRFFGTRPDHYYGYGYGYKYGYGYGYGSGYPYGRRRRKARTTAKAEGKAK